MNMIKEQDKCYRTIDGIRWINVSDLLSPELTAWAQSQRARGIRLKFRKHPDGYSQVFCHPEDMSSIESFQG